MGDYSGADWPYIADGLRLIICFVLYHIALHVVYVYLCAYSAYFAVEHLDFEI